jgi:hypothetical protein
MSLHRRPVRGRRTGLAAAALAVAALTILGASAPALAAKGGGHTTSSGGSTLELVLLDSTDGVAHYGQSVTFNVSTSASATPMVSVDCYQGSDHVYTAMGGFYDSNPWPWTKIFNLASGAWTGGAADCHAVLYYHTRNGRYSTLATNDFHVEA